MSAAMRSVALGFPRSMTPASDLSFVEGLRLCLRLVEPNDAAYIHSLRTDPTYNAHLSTVTGTVDDQRAWIERYKAREAAGAEYYYVIERREDGQRCGLVRLYDIEDDVFTWGSWILDHNKPRKAALESALLSFGVGFEGLGKSSARLDVRRENTRALEFYRRFGLSEVRRDAENVYFECSASRFAADRARFLDLIRGTVSG